MYQTNQPQMGQQIMPEPPNNMISAKDHLYLTDALSWELGAMKMMHHAAMNCADPEISEFLNQAGQMHQTHYMQLLTHLNPANAANM